MNNSLVFKDSSQKRAKAISENLITEGSIWKALLTFFFPILFGTFFQQLYNTVDTIVVGRFVGKQALAAVGGGTAVFVNLLVGFFVGLTSGAGVLISQFYGAKDKIHISRAVHTAITLCAIGGIIMTIAGISLSRPMMVITKTPQELLELSTLYLKIYFLGMIPMFIYNMGSGILRAVGNSKTPLLILIVGCFSNILLDLLFVVIFKQGVRGVALATVICQTESAILTLVILAKSRDSYRFNPKELGITPHILGQILKIGFPAGIQSVLYTVSNLIIQTNINSFGTNAVAAWATYGKVDAIFWMMVSAFGIAVTTFAGQNYGAKKYDRVWRGMYQTLIMTSVFTLIFCVFFWYFGGFIFLLFTEDAEVISLGVEMLHFLTPWWLSYISIEILSGTIRGTGESLVPTLITVFGVCILRILWLFVAVPMNNTINMVMASYPITWSVTSIAFWGYYAVLKHKFAHKVLP